MIIMLCISLKITSLMCFLLMNVLVKLCCLDDYGEYDSFVLLMCNLELSVIITCLGMEHIVNHFL